MGLFHQSSPLSLLCIWTKTLDGMSSLDFREKKNDMFYHIAFFESPNYFETDGFVDSVGVTVDLVLSCFANLFNTT